MRRALRALLWCLPLLAIGATWQTGPGREAPPALPGETVRVPQDQPTIQAAVDVAEPGGLVLVSPGVYEEAVVVRTPFLTIRGLERGDVVLEGGAEREIGLDVLEADGVAIENLTVQHFSAAGVRWSRVFGFRASYVTVDANGDGLVITGSRFGHVDHVHALGNVDAGISVSSCAPCSISVSEVVAHGNAVGLRTEEATGDVLVVNSEFAGNAIGVVVGPAPEATGEVLVAGNRIHDNGGADAAPLDHAGGTGVVVHGSVAGVVTQNVVEGHPAFGVAIAPGGGDGAPASRVEANVVRNSGYADLALEWPAAGGDCFSGNTFGSSMPAAIAWWHGCSSWLRDMEGGSMRAAILAGGGVPSSSSTTSEAPVEPDMPGAAEAPPNPAVAEVAVPQRVAIGDARVVDAPTAPSVDTPLAVMGMPLASWGGAVLGWYAYVLPLVVYSAWVSIAVWDLARQDAVPNRTRVLWIAVVLAVPIIGPVAYFVAGRSPIQASIRAMLVGGGLVVYILFAALAVAVAS